MSSSTDAPRENYLLKVALLNVSNPRITRTLSCPADATFEELHEALQIAFGWTFRGLYEFSVLDTPYQHRSSYSPLVISNEKPLDMGSETRAVVRHDMKAPTEWRSSRRFQLHTCLKNPSYKQKHLIYVYDYGNDWQHSITLLGRGKNTEKFVCLDGEGHACAEEAGFESGWEKLKEAYRAKSPSPEQEALKAWYENDCENGYTAGLGTDKLWRWDQDMINSRLMALPKLPQGHDRDSDTF